MMDDNDLYRVCNLPVADPFALPPNLAEPRAEAIRLNRTKWDNGTTLTYFFVENGLWAWPEAQRAVVRGAFARWKQVGIGLSFKEVPQAAGATLLIGRLDGDGSWSYVGTDVLSNRRNGCNMNFGWDLTTPWGGATALHEIGHAVGMPHEHQNPKAGLVWNEAAVIAYYSGPPNNWDEAKIRNNILRKLSLQEVEGSDWDPRSIMHYPFKAGLIDQPVEWRPGTPPNFNLSQNDIDWVRRFYPDVEHALQIRAGEQAELQTDAGAPAQFRLQPDETRTYQIGTRGASDARIIVFKAGPNGLKPLASADDAGRPHNASVDVELEAGASYLVAARTIFADKEPVRLTVQ